MTSLEMPQRVYMPCAFAGKDGATVANILAAESSTNVNFPLGFPPAYGCPESGGGKFVSRGEMNALGHISTQNEFARACGGIVTFDPQLADQIGGYPAGAVLDFLDGINYCKVISLRDNNAVDFRAVGVDDINWARIDMVGTIKDPLDLIDISDFDCLVESTDQLSVINNAPASQCVGMFKSKWDGSLYISGGANIDFGSVESQSTTTEYVRGGAALVAYESDSLNGLNGVNPFEPKTTEKRSVIFGRGWIPIMHAGSVAVDTLLTTTMNIHEDKYYSIFLVGYNCKLTNSTLKVKVAVA